MPGRNVNTDDLLTAGDVAVLLGLVNHRAVAVYRRRYDDFPAPAFERGRVALWHRPDVEAWRDNHR